MMGWYGGAMSPLIPTLISSQPAQPAPPFHDIIANHRRSSHRARTELAMGVNPDSKRLAQSIIDSQSTEIAEMKSILAEIPG